MKKIKLTVSFVLLVISFVSCQEKKTLLGEYIKIDNEVKITIDKTMGWGGVEYVFEESGKYRLGRFNDKSKVMTVFKSISPDRFDYYLKFSDDFNLVYLKETGKLMYVKVNYYKKLSSKEKNSLKTKK